MLSNSLNLSLNHNVNEILAILACSHAMPKAHEEIRSRHQIGSRSRLALGVAVGAKSDSKIRKP
jgi:hypothetical protein